MTAKISTLVSFLLKVTHFQTASRWVKLTSCHIYQGLYYAKNLNTRTIAIQSAVNANQVCTLEIPPLSEVSFNFLVTTTGSYVFKFYKGKDAADKNLFEEVEIQVVP
jgi:hypothetical protein